MKPDLPASGPPALAQSAAKFSRDRNRVLNHRIPASVQACLSAPDRLSPMFSGGSRIRAKGRLATLVVRTASEDIEVQAPALLLEQAFNLCDGTRTIDEILKAFTSALERSEFAEFIDFLLAEGALIDASLASAHAAHYGFQFSPFGLSAAATLTDSIATRFLWNKEEGEQALPGGAARVESAPLDPFFSARATSYTFDDKPVPVSTLHQLLWSLAGVVQVKHPRIGYAAPQRTIASAGGMHLVEVYVALQRQVGNYPPGAYRVHYPDERTVLLLPVKVEAPQLALAFGKPWELTYATGAVFLAADPAIAAARYRNRSLQYLFMEAGAALHNGALSADTLGLGYATIGGYYERPISRMCRLDRQLVLGSAMFGIKATPEQIAMMEQMPLLDFAWVNGESGLYSMGFHLARAKIIDDGDERPHTWGRGTDPALAARKAIAEAIEREGFRQPRGIVEGTITDVENALDPRQFVRYTGAQYEIPDFFYRPFSETKPYPWADAVDLTTGERVRVLAELVFSRNSLAALGHDTSRPYTQVTSSGCAASTTSEDATARALLEVVERDAFMRHWLAQKPGSLIPPAQWPADISHRVDALQVAGCRVTIQHLEVPWAQVALVSAQHDTHHFTTMGTAASDSFASAVHSSLDEVEARVYAWIHGHLPGINHPDEVETTEHHFEIYGLKRYYRRADRLLFPASASATAQWPANPIETTLSAMVARFAAKGLRPLAVDITPAKSHIDQGRTHLSVVKALIPGLLPISFGHQREPLGMVPRIHSGSKFPHPFP